ncbi:MAG: hypothetical protein HYY06_15750 [Deltaproteobacteria bacterium]|nr:hypothetical protein [Deltaproteobacteria bacterium]
MRLGVFGVVAIVASACSSRYYVRGDHLQRASALEAQTAQDVALPALDRGGDPTYLRVRSIRKVGMVELATGLQEVSARDGRRALKIIGWILGGIGLVYGVMAIAAAEDDEDLAILFGTTGASLGAPGITLLVLGYSLPGPEADAPGPGLPPTVQSP